MPEAAASKTQFCLELNPAGIAPAGFIHIR